MGRRDVEEPKEKRQSEMEEDPPITVALVFSTIQSRREPTSLKRNLNLDAETCCTIFAIFTKLFNDKKKGGERQERHSCVTRYMSKVT